MHFEKFNIALWIHHFYRDGIYFGIKGQWLDFLLVTFAMGFGLAGFYRVVEIKDASFSKNKQILLGSLHIIGVGLFTFAFLWTIMDVRSLRQLEILPFFLTGFLILTPLHIFLALHARIRREKSLH